VEPDEQAEEHPSTRPGHSGGSGGSGESGSVEFQLTAADVGAVARGDPRRRLPLLLGLCTLLLVVNLSSGEGVSAVVLPLAVVAIYGAYFGWWLPRRAWQRAVNLRRPQTLSWSSKGVVISTDDSTSRLNWGAIARVREVGNLATLHPSARTVLAIVPARAFASEDDYHAFVRFAHDRCQSVGRPRRR
jgi:hypothetical protein